MLVPVLHLLPSSAYQHLGWRDARQALPYAKKQAVGWQPGGLVCRQGNPMLGMTEAAHTLTFTGPLVCFC